MIAAGSFLAFLAAGVPISFALILLALVYIAVTGNWILLQSFPQQFFGGMENYGLLALPLFILLGEFMNAGGIGRRLMALALAILGQLRGGLAYVNLVANMMMASILGSTVAQITIMSRIAVPEMERAGYPKDVSVAITAAGGLLAPIIPPSMMFIIFGVIAQLSIGDLFIAGIVPGVMMFVGFLLVVAWLGRKHGFPSQICGSKARSILEALPNQLIFPNGEAEGGDYDSFRLTDGELDFVMNPFPGQCMMLARCPRGSTIFDVDLRSLGPMLTALGGGQAEINAFGADYETRPGF